MAVAKVQVVVALNGSGVWRVVAPINPKFVRRLTEAELKDMEVQIPALIEAVMSVPPATPKKKK